MLFNVAHGYMYFYSRHDIAWKFVLYLNIFIIVIYQYLLVYFAGNYGMYFTAEFFIKQWIEDFFVGLESVKIRILKRTWYLFSSKVTWYGHTQLSR